MESCKKLRTPLRSGFTRIATQLEKHLDEKDVDVGELEILIEQLNEKWCVLDEKEKTVHELLANDPKCSQESFDSEYNTYESYKERYIRIKTKVNKILNSTVNDNKSDVTSEIASKRRFKLPKVELKKFSGDIKEWLGFWGQFKKIHEDTEIAPEDKFIYLSQSTVEGSRARELVDSFPPSDKNYEEAIKCLTARFGREDLLIEVYVRELLSLVLSNSMNKNKTRISSLYDKIESHIRALNSLGVTSDKYASILYPLVESCLPEDIIRVWERNVTLKSEISQGSNKLTTLMSFLKSEVEGEERIAIAKEGFGLDSRRKRKNSPPPTHTGNEEARIPTAVGLFDAANYNKHSCAFCERQNHESALCRYALKMNLDDRKKTLIKRGCCFVCLKVGHRARNCKCKISCEKCKGKHYVIMCDENK
jgi:hypothetical protein